MKLAFNRHTAALSQQAKVIALCLVFSLSMQMCYTSAIPIWEFLSRTEKLSHLYSIFGQLVSVHCKATAPNQPTLPVNQCKRNLLTYGNEKLQSFSDAQLDLLEPYQRGANELIWSAIMRDHASATLVTTRKPLHAAPASSIIILTHTKDATEATTPSRAFAKNPLFDNERQPAYTMDMDAAYGTEQEQTNTRYLTGPLVFRVRTDGTPVEEDRQQTLPHDDDIEQAASTERPIKHKIASISSLKQQHYAHGPYLSAPVRRRFVDSGNNFNLANMFDYYYGRRRV